MRFRRNTVFIFYFLIFSCTLSWADEVTLEDEKWHDLGAISNHSYEWFYFDLQSSDGNQLALAFLGPNPFDLGRARHLFVDPQNHVGVLAQAGFPDGSKIGASEKYHGSKYIQFNPKPFELRLGPNSFTMRTGLNGLPIYSLSIDFCDVDTEIHVTGQLEFESTMKGWKHRDGNIYKSPDGKTFHSWNVAVPRAKVNGWYSFRNSHGNAKTVQVNNAQGYHDHNFGTSALADTFDGWHWGRGTTADKTLIYVNTWGKKLPWGQPGISPFQLVYLASENEVMIDSENILYDFGDSKNDETAENGMKYPKSFQIAAKGDHSSKIYQFDVSVRQTTEESTPYYLRQADILKLSCINSTCPTEEGEIVGEIMDLGRLKEWILKNAFFPWWPKQGNEPIK